MLISAKDQPYSNQILQFPDPDPRRITNDSIEYFDMIFNTQILTIATLTSRLVSALPLDQNQDREVVPRAKSYSVVNVGGGASTEAPATTIVDQTTKTVEITNAGPTITAKVTATIVESVPAATSSSTSSPTPSSTPSSSSTRTSSPSTTAMPTPVFVTVTVTDAAGPTEYYDNGMWHTSYRVKTFEVAASSTALPAW